MSDYSPHSDLRDKLLVRAQDCRTAGTVYYSLPQLAQTALYGIAAELDEAIGLLEQLQATQTALVMARNRLAADGYSDDEDWHELYHVICNAIVSNPARSPEEVS